MRRKARLRTKVRDDEERYSLAVAKFCLNYTILPPPGCVSKIQADRLSFVRLYRKKYILSGGIYLWPNELFITTTHCRNLGGQPIDEDGLDNEGRAEPLFK